MSLYRRGDIWWSRIELDGIVHQFSTKARNKNTARSIESQKRSELALGRAGLAAAPTLETFIPRFINALPGRVSKPTFLFYVCHAQPLLQFPTLAGCRLDRIQPAVLDAFIEWRRAQPGRRGALSAVTVNHSLRTLKRALHLAVEWDLITKVPKITLLTNEHQRDYVLSDETIEKFAARPTPLGRAVTFLVDTGLRRAELVNLTWDAVHLDTTPCSIEVKKGKTKYSRRRVPLTARAEAILRHLQTMTKGPSVFCHSGYKVPVTCDWLSHKFNEVRKEMGLPDGCVLHSTRHTFCTRLGERGADAFAIQRLAGHSSIVISQRYVHATGPRLDAAIGLLEPQSAAG